MNEDDPTGETLSANTDADDEENNKELNEDNKERWKKLVEEVKKIENLKDLVFNDRLYSLNEEGEKDGNYLIDVTLTQSDDALPCFMVSASAEGRISGLRWTLRLESSIEASTFATITQKYVEEIEAGLEEDAGVIEKTTIIRRFPYGEEFANSDTNKAEDVDGNDESEVNVPDDDSARNGDNDSSVDNRVDVDGQENTEEETTQGLPSEDSENRKDVARYQYRLNKTTKHGEHVDEAEQILSEEESQNFISEGANIILLRFFVKLKSELSLFPLKTKTVDVDLNLVPVVYKKLDDKMETIQGLEKEVFGFEREIIGSDDVRVITTSYFLPSAHLASRMQHGSPTVVKLLSTPESPSIKDDAFKEEEVKEETIEKPDFKKKELAWEEDMMLYSKYIDRKEALKSTHQEYVRHHPELKSLLADFLQQLLLCKPDDVIPFSSNFFASFAVPIDQ